MSAQSISSKHRVMNWQGWVAAVLSVVLFGCGGSKQGVDSTQEAAPAAAQPEQSAPQYAVQEMPGSVVEGRILLEGAPPPPKKVQVTQDADACGKTREVYPVRVENGGVNDAVVWIDDIQRGKPFAFPAVQIEQKNCTYVPHVVIMQAGDVKITSDDPIPHNVHTYAQHNREYNESMNQLKRDISLNFPRPDVISVRCDLHAWMQAYIVIAKNPYYAVSAKGGKFTLDGVPPGHYHLKVWSESLGESDQEISVEAGKSTSVDFKLKSQAAQGSGAN
jgi:plastocyanin